MFLNNPIVGEIMAIGKNKKNHPFMPIFSAISVEIFKQEGGIPQVAGLCLPGRTLMKINTVEMLDDIYVKQNHLNTKYPDDAKMFAILGDQNILFMDSFHKDYNQTRKVLSAAFFKSKL